ncbi:MAG: MFS transporter [Nitrosomonadales bacterium]
MFAVMYYAPLMFQGGFGLSPNEAGLLITPLAVFITVGSIVNGRIVTRLNSPNIILYIGLAFFWIAPLILAQATITTSHVMIAIAMMIGGLGLGLLLPNLTLIAQASAPRTQLGVATAMLQSMRMVGSMLGTALVGSFISNLYLSRVNNMLEVNHGSQWVTWFDDPQILVNHVRSAKFLEEAARTGQDAVIFLNGARNALVGAIHDSQWFVVAFMTLALWLVHRIPASNIHGSTTIVE